MGLSRRLLAVGAGAALTAFIATACSGAIAPLSPAFAEEPPVSTQPAVLSIAPSIDDTAIARDAGGRRPLRLRGFRASLAEAVTRSVPAAEHGAVHLHLREAIPRLDSRGDGSASLEIEVELSVPDAPMEPVAHRWQERLILDRENGTDERRALELALGRMGGSLRQLVEAIARVAGDGPRAPDARPLKWHDAPAPPLRRASLGFGSGVAIRVARMDADERPDLLVLTRPANGLGELFVVLGGDDWTRAGGPVIPVYEGPPTFAAVDRDGDGLTDIVYPAPDTAFAVALQQVPGGLRPTTVRMPLAGGPADGTVSAGFSTDLDGDGRADYGFWYGSQAVVAARLPRAGGAEDTTRIELGDRMSRVNAVVADDLDGDGTPEIVLAGLGRAGNLALVRNHFRGAAERRVEQVAIRGRVRPMVLSARKADGTLLFSVLDVSGGSTDVAVADLDGDGRRDLVTADGAGGTLSVMLAEGADGFRMVPLAFPAPERAALESRAVKITDLDDDSRPDLVVLLTAGVRRDALLHPAESWIAAVRGQEDGSFEPAWTLPLRQVATDLALEDLDGDGRADYLVTGRSDTVLYLTDQGS